jgi:uncharacterized protein YuzE
MSVKVIKKSNNLAMNSFYDYASDILGFKLNEESEKYYESVELSNGVIFDFDKNRLPRALEILNASYYLKTSKENLRNICTANIQIKITEKNIWMKVNIISSFRNRTVESFSGSYAINNINAPPLNTELIAA